MPSMPNTRDEAIILLMHEAIDKIFLYTSDMESVADFENDSESFDATIMNFIVLGEAVGKLSDDFKERYIQKHLAILKSDLEKI